MTCYHPIRAYRLKSINPKTGKNWICFTPTANMKETLRVPCGQCKGCRLERARVWAIRCTHEQQLHLHSQYVTLTYDDTNLPEDGTLHPRDLTLFYKILRKALAKKKQKIRHFSCGEYGQSCDICGQNERDCQQLNHHKYEKAMGRPHYHAIIFGLELNDLEYYKENNGNKLYTSEFLTDTWGRGHVTIGQVTFESSSYVARYIMDKITGEQAEYHYYTRTDYATGEFIELHPEFIRMSNRPGIASEWYEKYKNDIYNNDEGTVIIRGGIKTTPPRYYEEKYHEEEPDKLHIIKQRRKLKAEANKKDNTNIRLKTKEIIFNRKIKSLIRTLE